MHSKAPLRFGLSGGGFIMFIVVLIRKKEVEEALKQLNILWCRVSFVIVVFILEK